MYQIRGNVNGVYYVLGMNRGRVGQFYPESPETPPGMVDRSDESEVPAVSAFRMYLRVVSESMQPEEISARLGTGPDEATAIGSRRRPQSPPRAHATWIRHVLAEGGSGRPEDLEPVVLGWGPEFAAALGRLAGSGDADVSLVVVQELTDPEDPQQKGIFLSAALLAWLAEAGASLDIDQYVYLDRDDQ